MIISDTSKVIQKNGAKMLIYGQAGVGKTSLAKTCPKPLILSAEAGLLSLSGTNIPVVEVESIETLEEVYTYLSRMQDMKDGVLAYESVFIDSITEIGEKVLSAARAKSRDGRMVYGDMAIRVMELLRKFRDLEKRHVIMLAQQSAFKDELSGITKYGPAMPGNRVPQQMPYVFDMVLRLAIEDFEGKKYRVLWTAADRLYEAKDRTGKLAVYEQPDIQTILTKIGY